MSITSIFFILIYNESDIGVFFAAEIVENINNAKILISSFQSPYLVSRRIIGCLLVK